MADLSVLDLVPITAGGDAAEALRNSLDLARHAERLGYTRYWLAEHHNMPGVASAATAVVIAHIAGGTNRIRVGSGGIMLSNHAPLVIAEQFGTLAALHPGRIDLGVGRAPGADQMTVRALRRTMDPDPDAFPRDVIELMAYFRPAQADQRVQAVPGAGLDVPVWILGSSTYGAQLAAALGLPYAFAAHFAPADLDAALAIYRSRFKPSEALAKPYVMVAMNIVAAETDAEAFHLFTSLQQAFFNLRIGRPAPLPPPLPWGVGPDHPAAAGLFAEVLARSIVGGPETVRAGLHALIARTGADEIMATAGVFDHHKRLRSFEIAASAAHDVRAAAEGWEPARGALVS